jgi:hypothetical protein
MMIEKRVYTRVTPENLEAKISVFKTDKSEPMVLSGQVLDISYRGLRIRLNQPAATDLNNCPIKIVFELPQSGVLVNISGKLCHCHQQTQLGFQFTGPPPEQQLDAFLFECVKGHCTSANNDVQSE